MLRKITSLVALGASFTLAFELAASSAAKAARITYDFQAIPESGPLQSNTAAGFFSYDDETTPTVDPFFGTFFSVSELQFDFLGMTYTQADATAPIEVAFGPTTGTASSNLLGLSYFTPQLFVQPGFASASAPDHGFTYDVGGMQGTGSISYTLRQDPQDPQAVPGPSLVFGLGGLALASWRKRARV